MNKIIRWMAMAALAVGISFAADVTGKWKGTFEGPNGAIEQSFAFKVEGDKLSGSVTSQFGEAPISEGKIEGDNVSFVVVRKFQDNEFKISYKGKLAGEDLKLEVDFNGNSGPQITLKREK